ncbi:MAG: hypothetical protein IT378_17385 [Sandaracinaceae bacterium]|nr:hypothetical protein [Sandaracinaceae bacterium]
MKHVLPILAALSIAAGAHAQPRPGSFYGRPVNRDGVHFQVGFGPGADTSGAGLFHVMEFGATFGGGITVGILHTFIQNRGFHNPQGGAHLIGGWMLELAGPLVIPELTVKVAFGLGGEHDQSNDTIRPIGGIGWAYGIDYTFPIDPRHGPTIGLLAFHTVAEGRHNFGMGLMLGWPVF